MPSGREVKRTPVFNMDSNKMTIHIASPAPAYSLGGIQDGEGRRGNGDPDLDKWKT
ncbi:hypothetical protein [Pseudogulbenkiania sp. NH8B]|uniref:hypothetical protein n=1 Tax=Pseudogulbenkiania sp. (strain NH8B) TaxID=748280 RepID=UPI0018E082E2|nr:hypothetical protein [Pseudogulbenkiania sp. NH8B]